VVLPPRHEKGAAVKNPRSPLRVDAGPDGPGPNIVVAFSHRYSLIYALRPRYSGTTPLPRADNAAREREREITEAASSIFGVRAAVPHRDVNKGCQSGRRTLWRVGGGEGEPTDRASANICHLLSLSPLVNREVHDPLVKPRAARARLSLSLSLSFSVF